MNHKHINNHIKQHDMEMEKNTITAGDQKKASEFEESVNHLYQPLDEWVKEDASNRSYLLIVSCVEGEEEDEDLASILSACGNKYIMKRSISKAMEESEGVRKLIIGSQKMFVANTINRIMGESDDLDDEDTDEPGEDDEIEEGGER